MRGGGNIVAHHELLGIVLATLQLSPLTAGTDNGHIAQSDVVCKIIGNSGHQRSLGAYDDHLDIVVQYKIANGGKVGGRQFNILGFRNQSCTGISGCHKKGVAVAAFSNLASHSMLTTT